MYQCWMSGVCCQKFDVQVSPQELEEMKAAGPTLRELKVEESGDGHTLIVKAGCPWFDKEKWQCSIYEHRPGVCRGYLCFRGAPTDEHRTGYAQYEFMQEHPEAMEQAEQLKKDAMQYSKDHGWNHL